MKIIEAAKEWNLKKYEDVILEYLKLINEEIERTKKTISIVINNLGKPQQSGLICTKKQAARLVGNNNTTNIIGLKLCLIIEAYRTVIERHFMQGESETDISCRL